MVWLILESITEQGFPGFSANSLSLKGSARFLMHHGEHNSGQHEHMEVIPERVIALICFVRAHEDEHQAPDFISSGFPVMGCVPCFLDKQMSGHTARNLNYYIQSRTLI